MLPHQERTAALPPPTFPAGHMPTPPPPPKSSRMPRVVDDEIIASWYTASDEREPEIWDDIYRVLQKCLEDSPKRHTRVRVWFVRRQLRWLRHQGWKQQYVWGRRAPLLSEVVNDALNPGRPNG